MMNVYKPELHESRSWLVNFGLTFAPGKWIGPYKIEVIQYFSNVNWLKIPLHLM